MGVGVGGGGGGALEVGDAKAEEKNQCIQIKLFDYPFLLYFTRMIFEMINVRTFIILNCWARKRTDSCLWKLKNVTQHFDSHIIIKKEKH